MTGGDAVDDDALDDDEVDDEAVGDDAIDDDADDVVAGPDGTDVLASLFATIEQRKAELPEGSYTAELFTHEKGENRVLEKLGEEATEIVLAAKDDDREALAHESADLVYHLLVLLAMKDLSHEDLLAELEARF